MAKAFVSSASLIFIAAALTGCSTVATAPQRESRQIKTRSILPLPAERDVEGSAGVLLVADVTGLDSEERRLCWID